MLTPARVDYKAGGSPVTAADLADRRIPTATSARKVSGRRLAVGGNGGRPVAHELARNSLSPTRSTARGPLSSGDPRWCVAIGSSSMAVRSPAWCMRRLCKRPSPPRSGRRKAQRREDSPPRAPNFTGRKLGGPGPSSPLSPNCAGSNSRPSRASPRSLTGWRGSPKVRSTRRSPLSIPTTGTLRPARYCSSRRRRGAGRPRP